MIVYHGSTLCVENPLVGVCRDNLDFGKGFYLTDICEQAISWAKRVAIIYNKPNAYLNKYELDYETICGDFMLRIEDTDQERFVEGATEIIYRTLEETGLVHDEGPDKDGGVGPYVQSERQKAGIYLEYAKKLIDKGEALKRLSYEQPNNQICLLNQSLIDKYLHFIDATNINKEERNDVTSQ